MCMSPDVARTKSLYSVSFVSLRGISEIQVLHQNGDHRSQQQNDDGVKGGKVQVRDAVRTGQWPRMGGRDLKG